MAEFIGTLLGDILIAASEIGTAIIHGAYYLFGAGGAILAVILIKRLAHK